MVTGSFRTREGIEEAVASGDTDLVGLARPLVLVPDLPHQLQAGTLQPVQVSHFSTGWHRLDRKVGSLIGLAYYEQQMAHLAAGQAITRPQTAWPILGYALREQGLKALIPWRG